MQFALSEDEAALKDVVDRFVATRYGLSQRRQYRSEPPGYSLDNWRTLAQLGLLGMAFSTQDGGLDCTPPELAAAMEALGAGLVVEPLLEEIILAGRFLAQAGHRAQKEQWLPRIISGEAHLTIAHFEHRARFNLADVRLRADSRAGGTVLNGEKIVVPLASTADAWIVSARERGEPANPDGIGFYIVDPECAGIERRDFKMADGATASAVTFRNTPATERLRGDFEDFASCIDVTRFAACAEMIGIMSTLQDSTLEYLRTRKQFGAPLASFQVLRHRLVDQYVALEQSRSLVGRTALFLRNKRSGAETRRSVAGTKSYVSQAAIELGESCLHLHGAMGMTDELAIGHGFKRLLMLANLFGDADSELMRFADLRTARSVPS